SPLPTPENPRPRSTSSASDARKTPPHSSYKSKSWSSSADGTGADLALPPRTPTRLRSDPVAPPRRRQNTLSDLPATSPPSSGVTANLAREGRLGRVSSCSKTWHSYPVCFNPNHLFIVEYSDTLLADQSRTPLGSMGTYSTPIHMAMLRNGKILVVAGSGT